MEADDITDLREGLVKMRRTLVARLAEKITGGPRPYYSGMDRRG